MRAFLLLVLFAFPSFTFADSIDELTTKAYQRDPIAQYALAETLAAQAEPDSDFSDILYWYEQSALAGNSDAQSRLATLYAQGDRVEKNLVEAIRWYTQLAIKGNAKAQAAIGRIYLENNNTINHVDYADVWLQAAATTDPVYEDAHNKILEQKFNNKRAQQVSAISQLDAVFDAQLEQPTDNRETQAAAIENPAIQTDWIVIALVLIIVISSTLLMRFFKQKKLKQVIGNEAALNKQVKELRFINKQQKRQLEKVFKEFKKVQHAHKQSKLAVACAIMGYTPSAIPDEKSIKLRFRQLSKVYHPDAKGSEAEMKRLNGALKIVLQYVSKT